MRTQGISSVLFSCDHNAVRSPMAEALMKLYFGKDIYVQSAGVRHDLEIDGFAIAVCEELGATLHAHKSRSFEEMEEWGDAIDGFDLVVALSPRSYEQALKLTNGYAAEVEFWDINDPTAIGTLRDEKLEAYRATRDQIITNIKARFGSSPSQ